MDIIFQVRNQILSTDTSDKVLLSDSKNYVKTTFTPLTSDWNGIKVKLALFYYSSAEGDASFYYQVLDKNNTCYIPWECLLEGNLLISLIGYSGNTRITTNSIMFKVVQSGYQSGADEALEPTQEVYEKIIEDYTKVLEQFESVITQAQILVERAEDARDKAYDYANDAITAAGESNQNKIDSYTYAVEAGTLSLQSKSYAIGESGIRSGEETDNAKYYANQAENFANAAQRASESSLRFMGSIAFSELPTVDVKEGHMYEITDNFTSDERFKDGGGLEYPAGTNIAYTSDNKWNTLIGTTVLGIKGTSETSYRTGNVEISKKDIGLSNVDNTADADKSVASASRLSKYVKIGNANFNGTTDISLEDIGVQKITITQNGDEAPEDTNTLWVYPEE